MKLMRLASLTAFALVLGAGLFARDAEAAVVNEVRITSPDSGAWRGIDSLVCVRANIQQSSVDTTMQVYFWLVVGGDSTKVLFDTTPSANADGPIMTQLGLTGTSPEIIGADSLGTSFIAANRQMGSEGAALAVGDGDSITFERRAGVPDSLIFKWYAKIPASTGTFTGVRAAVMAVDISGPSGVVVSGAEVDVNIDGDRPPHDLDGPGGNPGVSFSSVVPVGGNVVTGFTSTPTTRTVLGIDDTVKVNFALGNQADNVVINRTVTVEVDIDGKARPVARPSDGNNATYNEVIVEGNFDNLADLPTPTIGLFLVDEAGNRSSTNSGATADDAVPVGLTLPGNFSVDGKRPTLGSDVVDGDTLLPANGDTITDGSINTNGVEDTPGEFANDLNPISYILAEALGKLEIKLTGSELILTVENNPGSNASIGHPDLGKLASRRVDFTTLGNKDDGSSSFKIAANDGSGANTYNGASGENAADDMPIETGVYTVSFVGTDVAGNVGAETKRTDIYVDVDDISLDRLFPTNAGGIDTLNSAISNVSFKLSEPACSLKITYRGLSGPDEDSVRTRVLAGGQLTDTETVQTFAIDGLKQDSKYELTIVAKDLAGNFTQTHADTFWYDTLYMVPVASKFIVTADTTQTGLGSPITAGTKITLTIQAVDDSSEAAPTFDQAAVLKIAKSDGSNLAEDRIEITGTGATYAGNGRVELSADDWVVGERVVCIRDTSSIDTLSITIVDSTDTNKVLVGQLDSVIVVNPNPYSQILVSVPDEVNLHEEFNVYVTLADNFGNRQWGLNRYVLPATNYLGVDVPQSQIYIKDGMGHFKSQVNQIPEGGELYLRVTDAFTTNGSGPGVIDGESNTLAVRGSTGGAVDGPDDLIAEDYMGADGAGDQGGFVLLVFDKSTDHNSVTKYRIWREIQVNYRAAEAGEDGTIIALDEPASEFVPWGYVDAVPGADGLCYVVVATLDNVATLWAVSAEIGRATSAKEAFTQVEAVAAPYELMAETMVNSKAAAKLDVDGPVFATLTPEALAFAEQGVVPNFKSGDATVLQSAQTITDERVRAIDNMPPEAISALNAFDTRNDAGGSISLSWAKSPSDRLIPRADAGALGPVTADVVPGVAGYNVYRKVLDGEYSLIGATGPGETNFVDDVQVLNGERYTYTVKPFDADNEVDSGLEQTSMAIRNKVLDSKGQVVLGLFGPDNKVGFDDFFIFADQYGLTADDTTFEPAFDLNVDNKINLDDFFTFADYFGRGIDVAGKTVPLRAGLNSDAALDLDAGLQLPAAGEEVVVNVDLANFADLKGYGFMVNYDATVLEFVDVRGENSLLGAGELAQPQVLEQKDGEVAVAAFGTAASEGDLGVSLVFRTKGEIENSYIDLTEGELHDSRFGFNQVTQLGSVQIQTRPEAYALLDNFPNPFNPETTIKYNLPEAADVRLEIYNVVGQVVNTLVNDHQNAGRYTLQWDATNSNGQALSSGIYFYRVQAGEFQDVKKMLLLK